MPATMAGSRGGTAERSHRGTSRDFVDRLLTGRVGLEELRARFEAASCPQNVTLVVNNICNLSCGHCYLQVDELTDDPLAQSEWDQLADSIAQADPGLVCLSGKEIFIGDTGADLLKRFRAIKDERGSSYRLGLITNGTLVHRHTDAIQQAAPSYFDISVDGVKKDHNAIRGRRAFKMSLPNIKWAVREFGEDFFVNMTLQKQNHTRLKEAVDYYQQLGIQNVSLGFYRSLPYTDSELALSASDVQETIERLAELETIAPEQPLTVFLDLDLVNLSVLKAFLRSSWFAPEAIEEDLNGQTFIEHRLLNGVRIKFRLTPYPTGIWRSVRITPEGNYLAAEDSIDTTGYAERAIGNVRDFDYDFGALQAHALASPRFEELLRDYYKNVLPELSAAYRERPAMVAA